MIKNIVFMIKYWPVVKAILETIVSLFRDKDGDVSSFKDRVNFIIDKLQEILLSGIVDIEGLDEKAFAEWLQKFQEKYLGATK